MTRTRFFNLDRTSPCFLNDGYPWILNGSMDGWLSGYWLLAAGWPLVGWVAFEVFTLFKVFHVFGRVFNVFVKLLIT